MIAELEDFIPADVSDDYDFWNTPSGQLVIDTHETFRSLFAVPNEWLNPEFVDHRRTDTHTPVNLKDGKIEVIRE